MEDLIKRLRKSAGTFPGRKWYGGPHPPPDVSAALLREAAEALSVSEKRAETLERERDAIRVEQEQWDQTVLRLMSERDSSQASLLRVVEALKDMMAVSEMLTGSDNACAALYKALAKARTALSPHTEK